MKMRILLKKKKKIAEKKPVPIPKKRTRKVTDDEDTKMALKEYFLELGKGISPKHISVLKEYLKNGFVGYKAYMKVYPKATKHSAKSLSSKILKQFNVSDLLSLSGFGIDKIIKDLGKLSPDRRLFYLVKLHKLDVISVEALGALNVTVVNPPQTSGEEESERPDIIPKRSPPKKSSSKKQKEK